MSFRNVFGCQMELMSCYARIVNTDQTSGMKKEVRDFQASSVPLGRFAEVCFISTFIQLTHKF